MQAELNLPMSIESAEYHEHFLLKDCIHRLCPDVKFEDPQEFVDVTGVIVCMVYLGELTDEVNQKFMKDLREEHELEGANHG